LSLHPFLEPDEFIAFAHRGGAQEAPENTMAAFQKVVDLGYRYIETDAIVTRDDTLLCFHDLDLQRLTGRDGVSTDLQKADLKDIQVHEAEPIPLLEDVLAAWPNVRFNIEPKNDRAVVPLIEAIKRVGAQDRVCLGTFPKSRLDQIRRLGGDWLCTAFGHADVIKLLLAGYWLPIFRIDGNCAQVPSHFQGRRLITKRFIRAAERRGFRVHAWTINEASEMERLLDLGVHGIMTDRPKVLRDILKSRGIWTSP
jgi:glycerophosphoryl diester phosphodiesterase